MIKNQYTKDLMKWYYSMKEKYPNLDNPKTFNEKLQWLKIYNALPIKTRLADKYLVRDWIKEKIGDEYLVPLLGVYDKFNDIDFDKLPNQFVMKCNHGSGWNIIVKDKSKLDIAEAKQKMDLWMASNYVNEAGYELHYRDIEPKIIIEKFIENEGTDDLYDYKFWCFNGKVEYIQFLSERNLSGLKMAFYDREWNKQNFVYSYPMDSKYIEKPRNLNLMIKLAEILAKDFLHVRVDFYRLNDGRIIFGEMTFASDSGMSVWNLDSINYRLGNLIKLPEKAYDLDAKEYYKLPENYHKKMQQKILDEESICFKLFNILPILKIQKDMFVKVYNFLGLPLLKKRIISKGKTVKYSILGFPVLKISKKL